ncbi:DUF3127 domain-containing protein [bacterium]|nr:MAG: DUF3127 domain-containing protein [bacterium]
MALEISGKVIQVLSEQTGTGRNGQWTKQDFVIETQEQYPRKICFSAWGEKVSVVKNLKTGSLVNVSFNAESREFNGRWYTDLRAWKIDPQSQSSQAGPESPEMLEPLPPGETEPDDLPF